MLTGRLKNGTGTRARHRPAGRGQDRHDTDNNDAWFIGYTPQFTTAVWMGDPQRRVADEQRRRHSRVGRQLPGPDLGRVHEGRARENLPVIDFTPPDEKLWPKPGRIDEDGRKEAARRYPTPRARSHPTDYVGPDRRRRRAPRRRRDHDTPPTVPTTPPRDARDAAGRAAGARTRHERRAARSAPARAGARHSRWTGSGTGASRCPSGPSSRRARREHSESPRRRRERRGTSATRVLAEERRLDDEAQRARCQGRRGRHRSCTRARSRRRGSCRRCRPTSTCCSVSAPTSKTESSR